MEEKSFERSAVADSTLSPAEIKSTPLEVPEPENTKYVGQAIPKSQYNAQQESLTRRRFIGKGFLTGLAALVGIKAFVDNKPTLEAGATKVGEVAGQVGEGLNQGVQRLKNNEDPHIQQSEQERKNFLQSRGIQPGQPVEKETK